jgi:hypothetical protein
VSSAKLALGGVIYAMPTKHTHSRKLTASECQTICDLMSQLIAGHEQTIAQYRDSPSYEQNGYMLGQVHYCHNCISAYKHAISIAHQRAGLKPNV